MELHSHLEEDIGNSATRSYLLALNSLPDRCALDLSEIAKRIGADKLELIQWTRADIKLARLLASKLTT